MSDQKNPKTDPGDGKAKKPEAKSDVVSSDAPPTTPLQRRAIKHSYEKSTGRLHADNLKHPGITEADIEQVLNNAALLEQDDDKA